MSDTRDHYDGLAKDYNEHWLYSESYVTSLCGRIADALQLKPSDRLVDLGCGTGLYTARLHQLINLRNPVIGVDPSRGMLDEARRLGEIKPVEADAITFLEGDVSADKFLMKEAIHHIDDKDRARLFHALQRVIGDGIALILLLPPTIDYPLFRAAIEKYEELQPHYRDLETIARANGLTAESSIVSLPLEISKDKYLRMVKDRYMSLLAKFSDKEIADGIQEIDATYPESILSFSDSFVFLRLLGRDGGSLHSRAQPWWRGVQSPLDRL